MKERELLTVVDVGRLVGLGPDGVRLAIQRGELAVAARTRRGVNLVSPEAADAFKRLREQRELQDTGAA
jgi:hypothetical protein